MDSDTMLKAGVFLAFSAGLLLGYIAGYAYRASREEDENDYFFDGGIQP